MHHIAWAILCILLIIMTTSLWTSIQSLQRANGDLRSQLAAAKMPIQRTCKVQGEWRAGETKRLSAATTTGDRHYLVHLPTNFTDSTYYPVLLFYPGKGASAEAGEMAFGLDALPAIVIYPYPTTGTDGANSWQGAPYSSGVDDVAFTNSILDQVETDLCIDRTKVYAAGLSNGGGFASLLSCRLSDRIAAYAIVSGAVYYPSGECKPPRSVPLVTIHGDADPIVPFNGSVTRKLPPIYTWTAMRAQMNQCQKLQVTYPNTATTATTWSDCKDKAVVQSVNIRGGGHVWGQVSNDYLWQFLSRFSL